MSLKTVTDSGTCLPPENLARLNITEVQVCVYVGRAGSPRSEWSLTVFDARVATADRLPATSRPGSGAFLSACARLEDQLPGLVGGRA